MAREGEEEDGELCGILRRIPPSEDRLEGVEKTSDLLFGGRELGPHEERGSEVPKDGPELGSERPRKPQVLKPVQADLLASGTYGSVGLEHGLR
jgi:hypothetical protein